MTPRSTPLSPCQEDVLHIIPRWTSGEFACVDRSVLKNVTKTKGEVCMLYISNANYNRELKFLESRVYTLPLVSSVRLLPKYAVALVPVLGSPETSVLLIQSCDRTAGQVNYIEMLGGGWELNRFGDVCNWDIWPTTRVQQRQAKRPEEQDQLFYIVNDVEEQQSIYFYEPVDAVEFKSYGVKAKVVLDLKIMELRVVS